MASATGSDHTPSSSPNPGCDDSSRTNLIINYLPQNLTESELFKMFVTIGTVTNCKIMRDFRVTVVLIFFLCVNHLIFTQRNFLLKILQTGYSYGFGFVNYQKQDDAIRAIQTLNGLQIQNKRIKVSYARPPGEDRKETNLYVTNLPRFYILKSDIISSKVSILNFSFCRDVTEEELSIIFSAHGNIVQMNLLKDKITGMPRGVAFVR